jgi:hypothetical protein
MTSGFTIARRRRLLVSPVKTVRHYHRLGLIHEPGAIHYVAWQCTQHAWSLPILEASTPLARHHAPTGAPLTPTGTRKSPLWLRMAGSAAMTSLIDELVSNELSVAVEPLLAPPPRPPYGGRRRSISDRNCFAAIVYVARTSARGGSCQLASLVAARQPRFGVA